MPPVPRIAIVGGGPAGLTLARILHVHDIPVTVFERDAHALERPQGGTLDLHVDSGQLALRRAGLWEAFPGIARYENQGTRLLDSQGRVLFEESDASGERPEVDRTALRNLLLDALPADIVRWGRTLRDVHEGGDGRWELGFDDGREGPFDLVVGADGDWSRIRPWLSSYQPEYTGLTFIELGIDDVDTMHPRVAALVGPGKVDVIGGGRAIIAQRNANSHVRGYVVFRVPQDWVARTFDFASPSAVRQALLAQFADWHPDILELIRVSNDRILCRPIHALPVGHRWTHRRGLTLIGDAAHVMSPFGGEGVNAAMLDAVELAERLVGASDWPAAVQAFEAHMFERVIDAARGSADGAAVQGSHDALALLHDQLRQFSSRAFEAEVVQTA